MWAPRTRGPAVSGAAGLTLLLAAAGSAAASPYETVDPEPAGGFEVAAVLDAAWQDGGRNATYGLSLAGPLSKDIEVSVSIAGGHAVHPGARPVGGLADPAVALKWRFHSQGPWAAAVEPSLTVPAGDRDMGEDWRLSLPLGVAWSGEAFSFGVMAGYEAAAGSPDAFTWGAVVQRQVAPTLSLGVEAAGHRPLGADELSETRVQVGLIWEVAAGLELHALVGRAFADGDADGELARFALQKQF